MNENELLKQAMGVLGRRQSEDKRKAAQKNVRKAQAARRKPIGEIRCTCTTPNDSEQMEDHMKSCLRYRALKRRAAGEARKQ